MISSKCLFRLKATPMSQISAKFISTSGIVSNRRSFTPRRALMYVPGNDERKLSKIPKLAADCICIDCEDGVSINKKNEARNNIAEILDKQSLDFGRSECSVRVNSMDTDLVIEDLNTILSARYLPQALHLPKVESPESLLKFGQFYKEAFSKNTNRVNEGKIGFIYFIESALGVMKLPQICEAAQEISKTTNLVPEAMVFGSDDFVASIGAIRTREGSELIYARQKFVTIAKAFGLQAIDMVHVDFKDLESLKYFSEEGARMGFTGKQAIHPAQIPVIHQAFSPSPEKVEWATQLIKEFREHESKGKGAFNFRGSMVDMPLVLQAQSIVDMQEKL